MPELAEVVDGQPEEVDEGVGEEVHSEESGDDNDSIPDLEETEAVADGEVAANGAGTFSEKWFSLNGKMFFNFDISTARSHPQPNPTQMRRPTKEAS